MPIALVPSGFSGGGGTARAARPAFRIGGPDAFLLGGDDVRLPLVDRQPAFGLANLGHVVDERGTGPAVAVVADVDVVVQAGEAKPAQLGGASACPGDELDRGADRLADEGLQESEALGSAMEPNGAMLARHTGHVGTAAGQQLVTTNMALKSAPQP